MSFYDLLTFFREITLNKINAMRLLIFFFSKDFTIYRVIVTRKRSTTRGFSPQNDEVHKIMIIFSRLYHKVSKEYDKNCTLRVIAQGFKKQGGLAQQTEF